MLGALVANLLGGKMPPGLCSAAKGEEFIKVGLVLLGLDVQQPRFSWRLLPNSTGSRGLTPFVFLGRKTMDLGFVANAVQDIVVERKRVRRASKTACDAGGSMA